MALVLDVGCGHQYHGTVNVDRFVKATAHRSLDQRRLDDTDLDVKGIPNFVCADARYLPFRDGSFEEVYSSHTLEHVGEEMFGEMVRVSSNRIRIVCPNQYGFKKNEKVLHIFVVNKTWFVKAAQKYGLFVASLNYTDFTYFPNRFFRFITLFPTEITFIGFKKRSVVNGS